MVTRSRSGIIKAISRLSLNTSHISPIPKSPFLALKGPYWSNAMYDEYNALVKNGTWVLVPRPADVNMVRSMWLFKYKFHADGTLSRYKARLVANDSSQQIGDDFDETFRLVVKLATIRTVFSLPVSPLLKQIIDSLHKEFDMTDLGYLIIFLHFARAHMVSCNPSWTPVDTQAKLGPDGVPVQDLTLYQSLFGGLQYLTFTRPYLSYPSTLDFGLNLYASATTYLGGYTNADWAGCPSSRRLTFGYCVFLVDNLLSWPSKRQHTISHSSCEAEYRGVAIAVAETAWIRNLLRELHSPLVTDNLVYCDNVSVVYMSANPVQHQRTKHIEIDIHFVRDMVIAGDVRVLHVSSRFIDQCLAIERPFSDEEIKMAVWECGDDKAPGPDGMTFKFVKHFWDTARVDFKNVVKHFGTSASLTKGCNPSFISLIPKVADPTKEEYRPISLIGCQYKVIAKLLANTLVLPSIISNARSAYIKGRQIIDGPLIVNELISWSKKHKSELMIFKVDFEKAFDSIHWNFLDNVMIRMGFGFIWRNWIKGCFNSATFSVLINGSPSKEFSLERGLRRGDPLSPFLFLVAAEALHVVMEEAIEKMILGGFVLLKTATLFLIFSLLTIFSLLGSTGDEKKMALIKWSNVIAPKLHGGLGIGSLKAANLALLSCWWWRILSDKSALWNSVIVSIHGYLAGANNDLTVLKNSMLFDDLLDDIASVVPYEVNRVTFEKVYVDTKIRTMHNEINTVNLIVGADPTIGLRCEKDLHPELPDPEERIMDFPKGKNNRFFWVDERVFPTVADWRVSAPKDEMPAEGTYSPEAMAVLNTHHMELFNLIRASNPTKVKIGTRPRVAHEVPLLTVTASRVIEMEDPVAATDSFGIPSTIERLPLDFANENPSQQSTGGDGTEYQCQETVALEVPPPENVTTTEVAPETGLVEDIAAMGPRVIKERRKRGNDEVDANAPPKVLRKDHADSRSTHSTVGGKSLASMGLETGSTFPVPTPQETPADRIQARKNEIKNLEALLEAETDMKKAAEAKNAELVKELENLRTLFRPPTAFEEFKKYEDDRVEKRCAIIDARLDVLSRDFDKELYPHILTAIAGRRWVIGNGLRLAVMKCGESTELRQDNLDLEAIEAYDPEANTKYVAALHALRDLKYPMVDQLESLKDAPIDVIMASLHLESDSGEDAPQWICELRYSSSQLKIHMYPEVRDLKDPWSFKEEILLEDAIAANVSRVKKKKKCRVVCRTHGVGSSHHPRSDGVSVSVPTVAPQGLAILLADAATQTETPEDGASQRLLRSKSLPVMYNLDWP
uniref:Ribonuclease H-like domain-containing protein n=1 Tax=Tanacetum cinerariifolium TaxID=118510 RepID=A0A6L2LDA0_TANCI|nr:ribonuclease H-like domain-containing protein [Tanacetum cinerariifolium]